MSLPPLPPGAKLDDLPPLPPGATLDTQASAPPTVQPAPSEPSESGWFSPKSTSGTVLRGGAQGASYGFGDELSGVVASGIDKLTKAFASNLKSTPGRALLRAQLGPEGKNIPDAALDQMVDAMHGQAVEQVTDVKPGNGSAYEQARDSARRENAQSAQENPGTYLAANVAGGIATPGPKAGPMKVGGATLKPWVGRALQGAGIGGVTGAGMSDSDTAGGIAGDTLASGAFGGVAAPVFGALSDKAGGAFARWLEKRSRMSALKAVGLEAGINNKATQLGYETQPELESLGAWARDQGDIIKPFGTPAGVAERVSPLLDESMAAKSGAIDEINAMAAQQGRGFDFDKLTVLGDKLAPKLGWDTESRMLAGPALETLGRASANKGDFSMADQVRRGVGNQINWKGTAFGQTLPEETAMMRRAYGGIAGELLDQARDVEARNVTASGKIPGPEDLGASNQIEAMNKRISSLMDIKALSNEQAKRSAARQSFTLGDKMLGGASVTGMLASGHDPLTSALAGAGGLAASGALKFVGNRMASLNTYGLHATAEALPGLTRTLEQPVIKSLSSEGAREATQNAFQALADRWGINAKSKEELADEAFLKGQSAQ